MKLREAIVESDTVLMKTRIRFLGFGVLVALMGCGVPEADRTVPDSAAVDTMAPAAAAPPAPLDSTGVEEGLPPFGERIVLFVEATMDDLDAARERLGDDDYYVTADDMMYYRATAYEFLENNSLPVRTVRGKQPLRFIVNGQATPFDFSGITTLDVIILYDANREPQAIAPIDIDAARAYYGMQ